MPLANGCWGPAGWARSIWRSIRGCRAGMRSRFCPPRSCWSSPTARGRRILLADFGVARQLGDISGLAATNVMIGTTAHAAPEQPKSADVDGRADQYALGCTAFHRSPSIQPKGTPAARLSRRPWPSRRCRTRHDGHYRWCSAQCAQSPAAYCGVGVSDCRDRGCDGGWASSRSACRSSRAAGRLRPRAAHPQKGFG